MIQVYEALVHWADVVLVGTPIRWGAASSLYYKMAERLNSVQNQITLRDQVLIQNKVAAFIITGGQDNIQAVAGQMLTFFGELGFMTPAFPFVAHSLGWTSENMERNMDVVQQSESLHQQSFELIERAVELSRKFINTDEVAEK
jgi:multimeric flavodoxin WrbA